MNRAWLSVGMILGIVHINLVALGAFRVEVPPMPVLSRFLNAYGEITGSAFSYGFFAPGVTSQIRAQFDVVGKDSSQSTVHLEEGHNGEVALRIGDIVDQFDSNEREEPLSFQRALAASLVGAVFAKHGGARSVTVRLQRFTTVSMAQFRSGLRPSWKTLYTARFINKRDMVSK